MHLRRPHGVISARMLRCAAAFGALRGRCRRIAEHGAVPAREGQQCEIARHGCAGGRAAGEAMACSGVLGQRRACCAPVQLRGGRAPLVDVSVV